MIRKLLLLLTGGFLVLMPLRTHSSEARKKTIEGTWIPVVFELGGQKLPDEVFKDTRLILTGGRYTYQNDHGTYKLLPAEIPMAPKRMDITGTEGPNKGKTFMAIYELSGDRLRICYDLGGTTRPTEFTTNAGTKEFLAYYRRAKPN